MQNLIEIKKRQRKGKTPLQKGALSQLRKELLAMNQLKWYTGLGTLNTISNSVGFLDCTTPTAGTGLNNRIGSKIHLEKFRFRGSFVNGDPTNVIRLLIFRWLVDNTSDVPSSGEIFDQSSDPYSGITRFDPNRFVVLYDELIQVDTYNPIQVRDINLSIDKVATFSSGTTGIGHIYVSMLSDSSAPAHPSATWDYQTVWRDLE